MLRFLKKFFQKDNFNLKKFSFLNYQNMAQVLIQKYNIIPEISINFTKFLLKNLLVFEQKKRTKITKALEKPYFKETHLDSSTIFAHQHDIWNLQTSQLFICDFETAGKDIQNFDQIIDCGSTSANMKIGNLFQWYTGLRNGSKVAQFIAEDSLMMKGGSISSLEEEEPEDFDFQGNFGFFEFEEDFEFDEPLGNNAGLRLDQSFVKKKEKYIGYNEGIDVTRLDRKEDLQFVMDPEEDLVNFDF